MIDVQVYNARNMKNIPGKKTDKADSEWIAKITRHALLMPSFIPKQQIRDSRQLSRSRKSVVQQRTCVRQMIHGLLDSASIKLSSVVSDIFGTSGMNLIKLMISEEAITEKRIRQLVHGPLCSKTDILIAAMDGYIRPTHIDLLQKFMEMERYLTDKILKLESDLKTFLLDSPEKTDMYKRITEIPGFSERSALLLLSEIGFDLSSFPASKNFCSWAGLVPGKKESAGINKSGRIQVRQRYLRGLLVEVSLASTRCKDTFYKAKYFDLKNRTGANKAIIAIAHKHAKAIYQVIKEGKSYRELTSDYVFRNLNAKDKARLAKITERMGKDAAIKFISEQEEDKTI
jgi:transposase